jgi:4-aminobutyrate aminotransferase/(S)-3-amino-2-methylpropionate transaminase
VLLVLDEIYTGFGRTGWWFACEREGVVPDLICLGKALTGGFPLSACVGQAGLMERAWPRSAGEALHTSTFLGHPVGCAMALAQIEEIRRRRLVMRSRRLGVKLLAQLRAISGEVGRLRVEARGVGLMVGLVLEDGAGRPASTEAFAVVKQMLGAGYLVLPEGEHGHVIGLTPPLTVTEAQLSRVTRVLRGVLERVGAAPVERRNREAAT